MNQDSESLDKEDIQNMVPEIVKDKNKKFDQTIYFENLYVEQMNIKFSFNSNPDFLNQTQLNSTLKFLVAMLMNMKHVELHFKPYIMNQTPVSIPIFVADIKDHYLSECYSHKQLLRILSSVGLLGNLHDTINNFKTALLSLFANPNRNGNLVFGITQNVYNFARYILYAISNTLTEVADSLFRGMNAIINHSQAATAIEANKGAYGLDDNEIDIEKEFLDNINSIAGVLDTQNKIWLNSFIDEELQAHKFELENPLYARAEEAANGDSILIPVEEAKNLEGLHENQQLEEVKIISKREKQLGYRTKVKGMAVKLKHIPLAILYTFYQLIKKINHSVKMDKGMDKDKRIRYPRYFGYTKELESYSYTKAFAVEIMKRINLNLSQSENITATFSLDKTEIILTENRILCVTQGLTLEDLRYWALLYSDILSLKQITEEETIPKEDNEDKIEGVSEKGPTNEDAIVEEQDKNADAELEEIQEQVEEPARRIKHQIHILHFNDHFNFQLSQRNNEHQVLNLGLVDLKFHKKVIEGNNKEKDIIEEIHNEILARVKSAVNERFV